MENTKPHEALRLQISKVSDIMEIGPKFSDAVSVNHLLSMILKQTLDLMAADVCIIWLKDKAGNLVPRISFGLRTSLILSVSLAHTSKSVKCIMNKIKPTNIYDLPNFFEGRSCNSAYKILRLFRQKLNPSDRAQTDYSP